MIPLYPHEPIANLNSLAKALGTTSDTLSNLAANSDKYFYLTKVIKKPDGSVRNTYDVKPELKKFHERINTFFLKQVKYPNFLHGSLKGKDYISNTKEHTNKKVVISTDVSNFFPSISKKTIHEVWVGVFNFSHAVADCLSELVTHKGFLVQGSKVSSYLANLVLWGRESKLVCCFNKKGYVYTRYVDDITISCNRNLTKIEIADITSQVYAMLKSIDVTPNRKKYAVMTNGNSQSVHRLNVNRSVPTMSKPERAKIKSAVFECESKAAKNRGTHEYIKLYNQTMGRVNSMKRLHSGLGDKLISRLKCVKPTP